MTLLLSARPNMLLFLLSRLYSPPSGFTTVPSEPLECRIFQSGMAQKNCGACSAFAVSAYVSMHTCLEKREDFIPSPYRVFDCANGTCDVGISIGSAMSVVQFGVGDLRDSVPDYGMPCDLQWEHRQPNPPRVTYITTDDPLEIKTALRFFGPLLGTMHYAIYRDPQTNAYRLLPNSTTPDNPHAIVVVGWDAADNWIVQNSWGNHWGDGFGRGRIAQDVLIFVFDPSVRTMSRICLAVYCVCSLGSVLATPPKHHVACATMYCVILIGGLLLGLMISNQYVLLV